jgi:hypothetical protein
VSHKKSPTGDGQHKEIVLIPVSVTLRIQLDEWDMTFGELTSQRKIEE